MKFFFQEENYGLFDPNGNSNHEKPDRQGPCYPCFIHRDDEGGEDILWGATFNIIITFLQIVLDYKLPDMHGKKVVKMVRPPRYMEMIKNHAPSSKIVMRCG
ncbi:MAG: hypothetical protein WC560_12105 [Syntrophales bacterium]